jgi:tetratricopeptide (TPR) repeat protein
MKGERESSLDVFREAVKYELSLGSAGQPATPLNNAGEVYKEMFSEDKAESNFLKATKLPDGCDHVLPSLNLSMLFIEQENYNGAKKAIDDFESCVAQFPLRNGEEHRALVHLARGRIDLHTGHIDSALKHLESALEDRQWFGKIGTDKEDLEAAVTSSLAQAVQTKSNIRRFYLPESWPETLAQWKNDAYDRIRGWWLMRRARQILGETLNDFEDISVRNTDSLLEYPTLGDVLAGYPTYLLDRRIDKEEHRDERVPSRLYYEAYLGQNHLEHGHTSEAVTLLNDALSHIRGKYDELLKRHIELLKLSLADEDSNEYVDLAYEIFGHARAELRNRGFRLPVNLVAPASGAPAELSKSAFLLDNRRKLQYSITYATSGGEHSFEFQSANGYIGNIKVKGNDLRKVINKLTDAVFTDDLGGQSEQQK